MTRRQLDRVRIAWRALGVLAIAGFVAGVALLDHAMAIAAMFLLTGVGVAHAFHLPRMERLPSTSARS